MARYQKAPDIVIPPSQPAVKSIQSGSFRSNLSSSGSTLTVNAVDPAKSVLTVTGSVTSSTTARAGHYSSGTNDIIIATGSIVSATQIFLNGMTGSGTRPAAIDWVLVEYA